MRILLSLVLLSLFFSCQQKRNTQVAMATASSKVDDCESPDADISCCFANQPDFLNTKMIITTDPADGEPLIITGKIFKADGQTPYPNVKMYAYHTDKHGHYSKSGNETGFQKWHGRLHGWCKTDDTGNYEIHTIRPAPYPTNTIVAHIHPAIQLPDGSKPFYINDFVFNDDPLVTDDYVKNEPYTNGGSGVVDVKKQHGTWIGVRDIVLQ